MIRTTPRLARSDRRCDSCECRVSSGERYLEHVASPDHDSVSNGRWNRMAECASCATRYGRAHLLTPAPSEEDTNADA